MFRRSDVFSATLKLGWLTISVTRYGSYWMVSAFGVKV